MRGMGGYVTGTSSLVKEIGGQVRVEGGSVKWMGGLVRGMGAQMATRKQRVANTIYPAKNYTRNEIKCHHFL